ncbi:Gfo/Idh/MocA family protein [Anaeromyxobacter oryzae]|uniref:Oxidoreductase n=1 Tax=Anaeromyxobacter oryzae TaxID=2918170 RepID=A0ABM7WWE6_9BACT|nr:Gfo/Idh/MocA family oxidoreductase [Anaeromyxobacter oryzae]BDG03824.1 oxidoreductase [Anaeromyxobacter oryzae]
MSGASPGSRAGSTARPPHRPRLRGALLGYGFIGAQGHVPAYLQRDDVEIRAVGDVCAARRALVAAQLPGAATYASADELFAAEAGRLDFVDIATPPCDHAAIAHRALDLGLHVLCEKPLATRVSDARALLDHAAHAKRTLFPCHNYKHAPVVQAVRGVIRSGRVGRVRSVTLQTFRNTHARGVPEWKPDWRRQVLASGGGVTMDHGSHTFYLAFDWMGAWPTAVTAKMANSEPGRWTTEDTVSAVLTFPNGLAHVHLTWAAGVRKVIYSVQGDRGAITVDDDDLQLAELQPAPSGGPATWRVERRTLPSEWMDASHTRWFNAMFDEFVAAIESGDHVGRDAQDAYRCIELIDAAYASAADQCRERAIGSVLAAGIAHGA